MRSGLIGWLKRILANLLTIYIIIAAIVLLVIVHQLGSHPAGFNPAESSAQKNSQSLPILLNNPVNGPHNLVAYLFHSASLSWRSAMRLSSAAMGVVFILSFYLVVKAWFSRSIGIIGTIFLAATPLFLVSARQGSAEIMFFSVISLMAVYMWLVRSENKDFGLIVLLMLCALLIYTPGLIWWVIASAIICRRKLANIFEESSPPAVAAALLLGILCLVPLGYDLAKNWIIIKQLALIPSHIPGPLDLIKHLAWMVSALFIKTPYHHNLIIGRLPVLNIIQDAMLAFGAFALWQAARSKLIWLLVSVLFAVLAAGLNDNFSLLIIGLPAIAIIITAGFRYLFIEWRSVFPKNPVPRTLAFTMMWAVVIVQLLFGIRYAVIAWPNTVETKQSYVLK